MKNLHIPTRIKPASKLILFSTLASLIASTVLAVPPYKAEAAADPEESGSVAEQESTPSTSATATAVSDVTIEKSSEQENTGRKEIPWLGISTSEASEALASQMDLKPGVGLVITFVAPDSPAAKAGLRKNDLLIEFDDQALVHPAQLRKLVRVRKEGDTVKLGYYRGGKRQHLSVTLGKTKLEPAFWQNQGHEFQGDLKDLGQQLRDLHLDDAVKDQMRILQDSLGNIKIDKKEVQRDIRQGMEQARKAIEEALRNVSNTDPVRKVLENFAHSGLTVDDKADVVVRSSGKSVKSVVKSDDAGTIVVVSNPKMHLTAHDKDGKLLFDGQIETSDERSKVPHDLWERVEPLLDQVQSESAPEEPDTKEKQ